MNYEYLNEPEFMPVVIWSKGVPRVIRRMK